MKIGKLLRERMKLLNITLENLYKTTYIDKEILEQLYNNKMEYDELDEYDKEILSNALFCSKDYFINRKERKYDIVTCFLNRGNKQDNKAIKTKCILQRFVKDFIFIDELKNRIINKI